MDGTGERKEPLAFLIPGSIDQPTGGYGYARAVMAAWRRQSVAFNHIELPGDFPFPSASSLQATADVLSRLASDQSVLIDGLAYGALPADVIKHCPAPIAVLLHHPLGLETGLSEVQSADLLACEKSSLRLADKVIVTSQATRRTVEQIFDVPAAALAVALPGAAPRLRAPRDAVPPMIFSVGSLTPRKGHRDLVAALTRLEDLPWTARFAGSKTASPDTVAELEEAIGRSGLAERIKLHGPLAQEAVNRLYRQAAVFALPSHYEGYGMAFAEALSAGLPIVGYHAVAVPDVVPSDAAILVEPSDIDGLARALRRLLTDSRLADGMASSAYRAGQALPGWDDTAETIRAFVSREGS